MTIATGARLGAYEITAELGAGGMGEVYRATDSRLKREVAIKVLPSSFATDRERVARFEREAQVLAQLHHPHIASIFGLEESDGTLGLVMELVEGEDLAALIARGALPMEEALSIARQIAEALEAAHERGIVHRDLKPANVKVRADGTVKVLDFGLAKAMDPASSGGAPPSQLAHSPTLTLGATQMGVVLGTAAYMAPEQAKGAAVDKRADIWAFGVVLWEMLTGKRLFEAPSVPETLAQVLTHAPELDALPASTPSAVRRVVARCLERNPTNRLHDIADARIELAGAAQEGGAESSTPAAATVAPRAGSRLAWAVAAAALLVAATLGVLLARGRDSGAQRALRFELMTPRGEHLALDDVNALRAFAVSPDGTRLVYGVGKGPSSELRLRVLETGESTTLPGTEGAADPFFSPDGKWVAFVAGAKLQKVALAGGTPVTIADAPVFRGAVWAGDGTIYFVPNLYVPIARVAADGGARSNVTRLQKGELQHRWPDILPGGKVLLYAIGSGGDWDGATIVAERLDSHQRTVLVRGGTSPRFVPPGALVYARANGLYAIAFDPRTLQVSGSAVEVARNVYLDAKGMAHMDVARNGLLVTSPADGIGGAASLAWIDREGHAERLPTLPLQCSYVALSPGGDRAVLSVGNGLSILDLARGSLLKLSLPLRAENPVWSRDGRRIYFGYEQGSVYRVFVKPADDSADPQLAIQSPISEDPYAFTADGLRLLSIRAAPAGQEVVIHDLATPGAPARLLASSPAIENTNAAFSPDGKWVAYASRESGRPEIYVRPSSGAERKLQVSVDGGSWPVWSPRGDEIFFFSGSDFLTVPIAAKGDDLVVGEPKVLFGNHRIYAYDVASDGKRFLVAEDPNPAGQTRLDAVAGWAAEVDRKLAEARSP